MSRHIDNLPEPSATRDKRVIVLSFGRNGTMSMMHALEMLGYKPYHMKTVFQTGASHLNVLNDAVRAKYHGEGQPYGRAEFDRWFADADALLDVTSFFVPEMVAAYPDAKFILTTREPTAWVASVNKTMLKMVNLVQSLPMRCLAHLNEFTAAWVEFGTLAPRHIWKDKTPGDDTAALQTYEDHNALVRKLVPADRLLDIKLEDGLGWEQLCPFLGHKIPEVPYPRGNDAHDFGKLISSYVQKGLFPVLAATTAVVVPLMAMASWQA